LPLENLLGGATVFAQEEKNLAAQAFPAELQAKNTRPLLPLPDPT
jgi:hypothetical protein